MPEDSHKQIVQQVITDVGGAFVAGLGYIGDRLGLFRALAMGGPVSSAVLADSLGLNERYVREWLKAMVSAGYVERDTHAEAYFMTSDQKAALAEDDSPVFAAGAFQFALPSLGLTEQLIECFRHGGGITYDELGEEIPASIDRMHRAWFDYQLTGSWLPAASGVVERLEAGIRVLDVGCGLGRASIAIGQKYPKSSVVGIDPHTSSIVEARALASQAGTTNVDFLEKGLQSLHESEEFDLILAIDCIHDMKDPIGVLSHIRTVLADEGVVFWSEPTGSHDPTENQNPPERLRSALSPYHCLTVSLAEGGAGLGTIIGETGARDLARKAGFEHFEKLEVDSAMQQFFLVS
jgi:2-polyprenyl-3-methyl-5-hydroxy-6-metoxy-1,4-benzoquinol methylase